MLRIPITIPMHTAIALLMKIPDLRRDFVEVKNRITNIGIITPSQTAQQVRIYSMGLRALIKSLSTGGSDSGIGAWFTPVVAPLELTLVVWSMSMSMNLGENSTVIY